MAHAVHTATKWDQPPRAHPVMDPILAEPESHKLIVGDHAVLPPGKLRDQRVHSTRVTLIAYVAMNVTRVEHPATMARSA
jgi:hypothetical protein